MIPGEEGKDYADSGLTIQQAMVDHAKRFPERGMRPDHILWNGLQVKTGASMSVPKKGVVRAEFVKCDNEMEQGFDIKVNGSLELEKGEKVRLLRTWYDVRLESVVKYPFHSDDGQLWIWNVYKVRYPNERIVEERWTGNAGFWVEEKSPSHFAFHCSPGPLTVPNFESLVFEISIR